jgi:hypothetical protein
MSDCSTRLRAELEERGYGVMTTPLPSVPARRQRLAFA